MQNFLYEGAKKALHEQQDMGGIAKVSSNYEYKTYFHILTYKYFIHNPKKSDKRQDYNDYYRTVKDKSEMENLSSFFNRLFNDCLKNADENKLYNGHIEDLEMIIAKHEIAVCKTISMCSSNLSIKEYYCSKDDILRYMETRDSMISKVEELQTKTAEHRRMMWD